MSLSDGNAGLFFDVHGKGSTPVVILHGLFGSRKNWRSVVKNLESLDGEGPTGPTGSKAPRFRFFTVDMRHHGESPKEGEFDLDLMAEDICGFIRGTAGGPAVVLGHSLGGRVAVKAFSKCPELFAGMILVDITPFDIDVDLCAELKEYLQAMRELPVEKLQSRKEAEARLGEKIPSPEVVRFLLQNLRRDKGEGADRRGKNGGAEGFFWSLGLEAIAEGFDRSCDAVITAGKDWQDVMVGKRAAELPLLGIRGGGSSFFPAEHMERLRTRFSRGEFQTVEGAGHWLHVEERRDFVRRVVDFLKGRIPAEISPGARI